jgi:hypothetical protein
MALLYPSVRPAPSDKVSDAERDVLDVISGLSNEWHALHSLWLKTHNRKLHAEADFVLITDRAVLIIEVKGGDVWRDNDGWHFRPKSGRGENVKKEGPFDQARGAYYALRQHLTECGRLDLFYDYVWGYGVVCPECVLHIPDKDAFVDPCMLLDERNFPSGFNQFIASLTDYWRSRYASGDIPHVKSKRTKCVEISAAKRQEILKYLRPQFELVTGIGAQSAHVEKELIRLTDSQLIALDFMALEPRNLLVGAAGTGKTVLLVEQARRKAAEGQRVLVLCFNKHLGRKISATLQSDHESAIDVGSYHQFVINLCSKAGLEIPFSESWGDFCRALSQRSADLISALTEDDLYDYVLIDEGQDLMDDEFIDLISCLLRGGLSNGSWMISVDTRQAIFRESFNQSLLDRLAGLSRKTNLSINCRNTRQIAAYVSGFCEEGSTITRGTNGEVPVIRYFANRDDYLRLLKKVVNELIHTFIEAGLPPSEIMILYAEREFVPEEAMRPGFFLRSVVPFDPSDSTATCIRISSVHAYKGLEAKAIVLLGISDFASGVSRGLFYVGASRAKTNLRILLPEDCTHARNVMPLISDLLSDHG